MSTHQTDMNENSTLILKERVEMLSLFDQHLAGRGIPMVRKMLTERTLLDAARRSSVTSTTLNTYVGVTLPLVASPTFCIYAPYKPQYPEDVFFHNDGTYVDGYGTWGIKKTAIDFDLIKKDMKFWEYQIELLEFTLKTIPPIIPIKDIDRSLTIREAIENTKVQIDTRVENILKVESIHTVGDLEQYDLSDLKRVPNAGIRSQLHIQFLSDFWSLKSGTTYRSTAPVVTEDVPKIKTQEVLDTEIIEAERAFLAKWAPNGSALETGLAWCNTPCKLYWVLAYDCTSNYKTVSDNFLRATELLAIYKNSKVNDDSSIIHAKAFIEKWSA